MKIRIAIAVNRQRETCRNNYRPIQSFVTRSNKRQKSSEIFNIILQLIYNKSSEIIKEKLILSSSATRNKCRQYFMNIELRYET